LVTVSGLFVSLFDEAPATDEALPGS